MPLLPSWPFPPAPSCHAVFQPPPFHQTKMTKPCCQTSSLCFHKQSREVAPVLPQYNTPPSIRYQPPRLPGKVKHTGFCQCRDDTVKIRADLTKGTHYQFQDVAMCLQPCHTGANVSRSSAIVCGVNGSKLCSVLCWECGIFFYWFEVKVRRPGMWPKFDSTFTFSLILSKWIMCKLVALSQSKHQHLRPCKRTDFLTRLWEINWYETSLHPLVKLWRTGGQGHHGPVGGPFQITQQISLWPAAATLILSFVGCNLLCFSTRWSQWVSFSTSPSVYLAGEPKK